MDRRAHGQSRRLAYGRALDAVRSKELSDWRAIRSRGVPTLIKRDPEVLGGYALHGARPRRGMWRSRTITEDEAMSIKRDDLDAGRVDFSDVAIGKRLPLIHPGEILRDAFLQPMKITVYALAQSIKVRARGSTTLCWAAAASPPTRRSASRVISPPRRIFGSTFRPATIWRRPTESFAGGSRVRSGRGRPDGKSKRRLDGRTKTRLSLSADRCAEQTAEQA
jgi:hypothetical protein